jgi:hypothetical protein
LDISGTKAVNPQTAPTSVSNPALQFAHGGRNPKCATYQRHDLGIVISDPNNYKIHHRQLHRHLISAAPMHSKQHRSSHLHLSTTASEAGEAESNLISATNASI